LNLSRLRWLARAVASAAVIASGPGTLAASAATPSPYGVEIREVWIPMPDGVRLSATLHFPTSKRRSEKFPAVLEYLPYRKDEVKDFSGVHDYFARHGLVSVQVDIRGTGRS